MKTVMPLPMMKSPRSIRPLAITEHVAANLVTDAILGKLIVVAAINVVDRVVMTMRRRLHDCFPASEAWDLLACEFLEFDPLQFALYANISCSIRWDHTRQRWYAACAFYTYSPLRLFSEESEIKYMSAFCDVILAELHRLEAQTSERAKSDFISTMSHELRSPLHVS